MTPNRLPFSGILARVESPSKKAPGGARGHRVILKKEETKKAISSLRGQAINCCPDFSGHNTINKIGVITSARLRGNSIHISGHLWDRDFPSIVEKISAAGDTLGMSYELADARVRDMRKEVWEIEPQSFVGAAVLYKTKAANSHTKFKILTKETK